MADIVNERDLIMQSSPSRTVAVAAAEQIVVPNFTGIKILSDTGYWAEDVYTSYWITPIGGTVASGSPRGTYTVTLTGMSVATPIIWQLGVYASAFDSVKQAYVITSFTELPVSEHGIILTNSADPAIKTMEVTSYPRSQPKQPISGYIGHSVTYPTQHGCIRVKANWGGTDFIAFYAVKERAPGGLFPWT